jgi:hypothetical protein
VHETARLDPLQHVSVAVAVKSWGEARGQSPAARFGHEMTGAAVSWTSTLKLQLLTAAHASVTEHSMAVVPQPNDDPLDEEQTIADVKS